MSVSGIVCPWFWPEKNETHCLQVNESGDIWHKWWAPTGGWQNRQLTEVPKKFKVDNGIPRPIAVVRLPGQWQFFGETADGFAFHGWKGDAQASNAPWSEAPLP
jgi:hypothetical protein